MKLKDTIENKLKELENPPYTKFKTELHKIYGNIKIIYLNSKAFYQNFNSDFNSRKCKHLWWRVCEKELLNSLKSIEKSKSPVNDGLIK